MAIRIIVWHIPYPGSPLPAFYMERDYSPGKLRIHAEQASNGGECQVDIRDDGTTIFAERGLRPTAWNQTKLTGTSLKNAVLPKGATLEEHADDFLQGENTISEGSVLTCHEIELNGAKNVTGQLELESADEDEESD